MVIVVKGDKSEIESMRWEDYEELSKAYPAYEVFLIEIDNKLQKYAGGVSFKGGQLNINEVNIKEICIGTPTEIRGDVYFVGLNESSRPRALTNHESDIIRKKLNSSFENIIEKPGEGILLITDTGKFTPLDPITENDIEDLLRIYLGHRTQFTLGTPDSGGYTFCINLSVESSPRTSNLNKFASKLSGQSIYGDIVITKATPLKKHKILEPQEMEYMINLHLEGK